MNELTEQVVLHWTPLLPSAAGVAAVVAGLLWLALSWRSSVGVQPRRRWGLLALRVAALAVLAVVGMGPTWVTTKGRAVRDPFAVLIDGSRSMRVQDAGAARAEVVGDWLKKRSPELQELAQDYELSWFLVDDELRPWGDARRDEDDGRLAGGGGPGSGEATPADGQGTDLLGSLFALRESLGGRRPAGALVVSDGADRAALGRAFERGGAEAVEPLADGLPFPVSVWSVGDPEGPADLAIRRAVAPPFGFVRRPLTLEVDLSNRGLPHGDYPVTLRADGQLTDSRIASLGDGDDATIEFELVPDEVGYHTWSVELPVPEGDTIPSNNRIEVTVKVVRDRTRVLQVTSRPSWDVKFLRRLLKTDPNVDLVSFFILRETLYAGRLANQEQDHLSLIAFPYEELFSTDLAGFDLVVFQNFWFGSFARFSDDRLMANVAQYVQDGGALLMVGGDFSFGEAKYGSSPLVEVLPTTVPGLPAHEGVFAPELTAAGKRHPVTRLRRDAEASEGRWAELPPWHGHNQLGPLQPDAVALVTGPAGAPVVVARDVGRGRSLAVATDTTWRWSLAGRDGSGAGQDHATFWRNALRWLVKDAEEKQVQVLTDQENYRLGEPMRVQVRVLSADYLPRPDAEVTGRAKPLGGGAPVPLQGRTDADGQIAFVVPADIEGTWTLDVSVPSIPDPFGRGEARVSVSDRQGELEDPTARPDLLGALAAATGGEVLTGANPDPRDAATSQANAVVAVDRATEPVWNHYGLLLLLLLPLGIEWILRRRFGLK